MKSILDIFFQRRRSLFVHEPEGPRDVQVPPTLRVHQTRHADPSAPGKDKRNRKHHQSFSLYTRGKCTRRCKSRDVKAPNILFNQ